MLVTDVKIFGEVSNREIMPFKLHPIFLCGMCIFPIFIGGIPLIDVFKQTPAINAVDFSSTDQTSEMPYKKIASDNSKTDTNNSENQLCNLVLTTLENSKEIETFRLAMVNVLNQISTQNNVQQIIKNIFTAMHYCMKQNMTENDVQSFWNELRNYDGVVPTETRIIWETVLDNSSEKFDGLINSKEDVSQEGTLDEQNSVFKRGLYNSRDLDDDIEDYSEVPALGFSWRKPDSIRQNKYDREYEHGAFERDSTKPPKPKPKPKTKIHGGRKSYVFNVLSDLGTPSNPIFDENFGKKISLFNDKNDFGVSGSPSPSTKKDDKGKNLLFLFDDELPDPSEKLDSKNLFYQ